MLFENNNYDMAYKIVPFYTEALEEELYTTTDYDKQLILANKIIKLNENVSSMRARTWFWSTIPDNNICSILAEQMNHTPQISLFRFRKLIYLEERFS